MDQYFISKVEVKKDHIIELYKERINHKMYSQEYDENLLAINEAYIVYPFIDGFIKNLNYLTIVGNQQNSGTIDARYSYMDRDFLLRNLSTKDFERKDIKCSDLYMINPDEINHAMTSFIQGLLDKTTNNICERHHLILTDRENELDIAPIREFSELNKRFYIEKVYLLVYYEKENKKTHQSLFSTIQDEFYEFDYIKSKDFLEFMKFHRKPIVQIPKFLMQYYEEMAFDIYLKTKEELQYIDPKELFHKIKKNLKYKDYTKYQDYLMQMIFYFRKKMYLSDLVYPLKSLKEELFFHYLTLKFQPDSGYFLAKKVKEGIIVDDYVKLLKISTQLKNSYAKKELYLYYSSSRTFNEKQMNRYL